MCWMDNERCIDNANCCKPFAFIQYFAYFRTNLIPTLKASMGKDFGTVRFIFYRTRVSSSAEILLLGTPVFKYFSVIFLGFADIFHLKPSSVKCSFLSSFQSFFSISAQLRGGTNPLGMFKPTGFCCFDFPCLLRLGRFQDLECLLSNTGLYRIRKSKISGGLVLR